MITMRCSVPLLHAIAETSKHVGANVESDFEADRIVHTFALSKDENKVKRQKQIIKILTI